VYVCMTLEDDVCMYTDDVCMYTDDVCMYA